MQHAPISRARYMRSDWRALRAMRRYVKAKRVAVAGECHNCHAHHGTQAEPQAMADPARCASEPRPYLRTSALTNTCEALAM